MAGKLRGKVAVVTGGGRGIGREYALQLAAEGADVVVCDTGVAVDGSGQIDPSPADAVAAEITAAGCRAVSSVADVRDYDQARDLMQTAKDTFGRLDILISNAGIIRPVLIYKAAAEDWSDVLAVHATGNFNCCRHASEFMIAGGEGGTIISVGSNTTDVYFPRITAYRAAKAAIAVTAVHLAIELRQFGINVNAVQPGGTATRMADAFFDGLDDLAEEFLNNSRRVNSDQEVKGEPAATPETVPPLGIYMCTDEGRHITGREFSLYNNKITLINSDGSRTSVDGGAEPWTIDSLAARLPGAFPQLTE